VADDLIDNTYIGRPPDGDRVDANDRHSCAADTATTSLISSQATAMDHCHSQHRRTRSSMRSGK